MNEESLFVEALDKPTVSERKAFLEKACAGDVALQQRVERLVAAHLETLGILDEPQSAEDLAEQAEDMLGRGRHKSAEAILRECVANFQKKQPESWKTFRAQSLLGVALLAQGRYAEAEALLVQGYEGLKAREGQITRLLARHRVTEAGERIVRLFEAWGHAEQAARWRAKLLRPDEAKPKP